MCKFSFQLHCIEREYGNSSPIGWRDIKESQGAVSTCVLFNYTKLSSANYQRCNGMCTESSMNLLK